MKNKILTVSALTALIKNQLEGQFPYVSVEGEISNFKLQSSGHLYFTLKDKEAQISVALFQGNRAMLTRLPKDGDKVIVRGQLSVYPPRGGYQIIVRQLEYSGTGELLKKLFDLKTKLQNLGWFDKELKKPLPKLPKTIGVVTSPTGSVIQDIINVLSRRFYGFHLILYPVKVQGEGAADEIAAAIAAFNSHKLADVLIVGRGGGSLEDLWPFNEEKVAQAIKDSVIPIVSAVGHETDFTIADFVADLRAPTPSAAAELVCVEKGERLAALSVLQVRLNQTALSLMRSRRHALIGLKKRHEALKPSAQLAQARKRLESHAKQLLQLLKTRLKEKQERLLQLASHLQALHPKNLLSKGYALLFHEKSGSIILSTSQVQADDPISIQLHDGVLKATVREKT